MTGISCVYEAFERGRSLYEKAGCEKAAACFSERMIMHSKGEKHGLNTLALGDNLRYMKFLADKRIWPEASSLYTAILLSFQRAGTRHP